MRVRFGLQVILGIILICQFSFCLAAEIPDTNNTSKYLDAVREFADNVLKYGRDTYGPKHTPLFVDGLNIHTHEPVKWIDPDGTKWILSNMASQQNLFRVLDGLTKVTGDPKHRQAAMEAIKYAFENLRSPNGLLYWGSNQAYDAAADKPCGGGLHEFKGFYPYYKLMWEVSPQATKQFIEAFWSAHILNWSNLDMNRHASLSESLEVPWKHEYVGGPVFFKSWYFSVLSTGSDLCYATAMLNTLSGEREPLVWGKRLVYRYVETRNRKTGFSSCVFSVMRRWGTKVESNDEVLNKLLPVPYIFPYQGYANRALLECHFGYETPTPGTFLNALFAPWICQLMLGELLGEEGKEFTQWALEELTAYGKVSYRSRDNAFTPMCLDGTSLEGYVCKEDGPLGFKGTILEPFTAGSTEFWAYALAYCQTDSEFMWEMTRNIALGNNYGDLGASATEESRLNLQTDLTDPYVIVAFLELHRKTNKQVFLEMARRIGDNVLAHRFHEGFFAPEGHTFTKFDSIDSLALLHLHAALIGNKSVSIPRIWPGTSFFEAPYRSKEPVDDNQLIYSLKDVSEPPISLQEAAADGNVEAAKSMIAQGIDVDGREDGFYKTALHRAVISGHKDVAELLLAKGADIDARDLYLASALHFAVENDRKEIAELLIDRGADINVRNERGETSLHYAVGKGRKEIVELLIDRGDDVNAKDASGDTPIHSAIKAGHRDIIEPLIANGADVNAKNNDGQMPVDIAVSRNRRDVVKLLIEKGADISLHAAARLGDLAIVKSLIEKGADINAKDTSDQTPLHYAVEKGHKDVVELLIANGANVNAKDKDGNTPGHVALDENNRSILELLIAKGANFTSIHLSAYQGDLDEVRSFIDKGADVNAKNKSGETPLHKAAIGGHKDVVELLIDNAADINAKGRWDYTPIYYAAWSGITEVVELLVEKGADVNANDEWGWTILHYLAKDDHREMAKLLITKGADVNAEDKWGETPLQVAKDKGHTEIVELLKKQGAEEKKQTVASSSSAGFTKEAIADVVLTGEGAGDNFGDFFDAGGDVNGDSYNDLAVSAGQWPGGKMKGRVYLYHGGPSMDAEPEMVFAGENLNDYFGVGVVLVDVNGDRYADVLVGSVGYDSHRGRVHIFYGGPKMDANPDKVFEGQDPNSYFGYSSLINDINGDKCLDLTVTAPGSGRGGRLYIFYGSQTAGIDTTADMILEGENRGDRFGRQHALGGDVNGDGYVDLVVGAEHWYMGNQQGRAYLYFGGPKMDTVPDMIFTGERGKGRFGNATEICDIDGDGFADIIVGAPHFNGPRNTAYVYFGGPDMDNVADKIFTFGDMIACGDVNKDGYTDIALGSGWASEVRLYHGGPGKSIDEIPDKIFNGEMPNYYFGNWVTLSDLNGDGYDDLVVGTWKYNSRQGRVYLYYSGPDK